jgi:hypothetical protein
MGLPLLVALLLAFLLLWGYFFGFTGSNSW